MLRCFHIVAIPIRIVINRFGDHDPDGMMYVLKENENIVKECVTQNLFMPVELVEPLTIRANVGDDIEVLFENQLPFATSMHIQRAEYDVQTSDGAYVGFNENSTASPCPPGGTQIYRWHVHEEGVHIFSDLGNTLSSQEGSNLHGLFGALIVQPKGSWWTDPQTGKEIKSGVAADIHNPLLPSFREFAWFFHDEMEVDDLTGGETFELHTLNRSDTHFVNYRAEPMRNRAQLMHEGVVCPDCEGEEVHHDSWAFGDPDTPIIKTYVGDPMKIRLIHGGVKETHSFHWHVHQWKFEPNDPASEIIDAQAISPQNFYTVSPLYGAGSLQRAFGDVVIHCHLYPHFHDGMWGMQRIFNTLQDGSQCYPNGVPIKPLIPLPDREPPPKPTPEKPGFPNFIPGIVGCKAPRPALRGDRELTELERNQLAPNAVPGAAFVNPCPEGVPVREFHVVAIQLPLVYNDAGWHDPEGRIYVLAEDEEDVRCGRKKPDPLIIRANTGDCIKIHFTNKLPEVLGGNAFQLVNRTYEQSVHVHFVKFDPLSADGANVGWNYDSGVLPGETATYQWFADVELKGAFFHDHLFANENQLHGFFGGAVIQAKGSKYLSPSTGEEVNAGTQAMITNPIIPDFREISLFVQDFALLFDAEGCPLNPPPFPGSHEDPGVMGVNYRSEPLQFRLQKPDCDPAYVFSSFVNGDPVTPILETYNGDPVRLRLFQGSQEESHSFNLHRQRWHQERTNLDSKLKQQQHTSIAESFTMEFAMEGKGDFDLLYHFGGIDDIWLGNWGIFRSFKERVKHLLPLPDREPPPERQKALPELTCMRPPKAKDPGKPCPENAPVRKFEVVAFQTDIKYNEFGDHDPFGIIFSLKKDEEAILSGDINPEPLILRANVGDCIEITLHNKLDEAQFHHGLIHGFPEVPVAAPFPPSLRISLHPQMLVYDVLGSDGATVGFNPDQTIAPGETITYRWYVDQNVGACNLWDMADLRNHRHHGAFGMLAVQPKGSVFLDPETREPIVAGSQAIISNPLLGEFREFNLLMHDGVRLVDADGNLIFDPEEPEEDDEDFEDQGSRGFNYRSERFENRLRQNPDVSKVFSSKVHGDPATPIFLAYPGDPVVVRFCFPADKPRAHAFHIHGHNWRRQSDDMNSDIVPVLGQISVGERDSFYLSSGAGGLCEIPGDYMYRSGNIRWDIELGMWGIIRVLDKESPLLAPLNSKGGCKSG